MAKKRKRSKLGQEAPMSAIPWSAEEKATLYGWLDYGVKVLGYSKEDFFSTVGIKLEDSGSTRHDVNKITSKLKRDWFRYGSTGYDFDDIFKDGASDLFGFSIEEKEQISAVKQQFVQESTNTTPARRLRRDRTSNQLRSMSRTPAQFSKNESPSLIKKESRIHGSPALKTYGKYRKRGRVQAPRDLETAMKQNKKSKHKKSLGPNIRSEFDPPQSSDKKLPNTKKVYSHAVSIVEDSEDSRDELSALGLPPSSNGYGVAEKIKQDNTDESISKVSRKPSPAFERHKHCIPDCLFKQHAEGIKPGEIMCFECGIWQHYACVGLEIRSADLRMLEQHPYHCNKCDSTPHQGTQETQENDSSSNNMSAGLRYKLDTAILEIKILEENILQMEREFEEYKVEARRIEDVSRHQKSVLDRVDHIYQGSNGCQSVETLLQEREEHIKNLEKKLNDRRSLGRFAKLSNECRETFGLEVGSHEGVSKVYNTAKQFALQFEPAIQQFLSPSLDCHPSLKSLVYAGQRLEKDERESFASLNNLNTQELLRFLTTSALFLWVFSTDFPKFVSGGDIFLMRYRECLLQQDGPTAVRNLDLATHHSLIRGKYFHQTFIRPEAEKLVIRFSQALAPLFSATPNSATETNWDGFSTWGQDPEKWSDRRSWLSELFQQALELKAESCLNTEDYQMVIYNPGTKYDENTMDVETEDGMFISGDQHSGRVVKICVEAAVFSLERTQALDEASLGLFNLTSNFVQSDREESVVSQVLVRAVVVLADT